MNTACDNKKANDRQKSFILIAEDDADDRFLMKRAVRKINGDIGIQFVTNGEELLGRLNQIAESPGNRLPGLVVIDLNMPKVSGHQVLEHIRKMAGIAELNIVVMSTSSEAADKTFCNRHGAHAFFTKPDRFEDLVSIFKQILARSGFAYPERIEF